MIVLQYNKNTAEFEILMWQKGWGYGTAAPLEFKGCEGFIKFL